LTDDRPIPARARVSSYRVTERYGLVWVALDDPVAGIPSFPDEYADPAFGWEDWLVADVNANAARFVENTMDQSHFAFVHAGILAVEPQVSEPEIEFLDDGFIYAVENPHNTFARDGPNEWTAYRLVTPFTVFLTRFRPGSPERQLLAFLCSPTSSKETRLFRIGGRNFIRFDPEEERRRARLIFEQDRTFVEAQRPEELPIDLREELHIKGPDGAAVEYRRLLGRIGVTWR
jgi:vanillate O-demethylase monooxygenase subunit